MKKTLICVIDMQNDFITGTLGTEEAKAIVPKVAKQLDIVYNQRDKFDILFTLDTHGENYLDTFEGKKLPVAHCIKGTEGWKLPIDLVEYFYDANYIFEKNTFGAKRFIECRDFEDKYDKIILMGLCTDICVVSNTLLLRMLFPEMIIEVMADCCAGTTKENHNSALNTMKSCQIDII